jgi:hypothetical protein
VKSDRKALVQAAERLDSEIANLIAGIAAGGHLTALVQALAAKEQEREQVRRRIVSADATDKKVSTTPTALRRELETRMQDWRGVLRRQPVHARQILKKLLVGPLKFTPKGDHYEFEGEASFSKFLAGFPIAFSVASLTGFEPVLPP